MIFDPKPIEPKHPLLKKYISYYYFLKTENPDFRSTYYAFPLTETVLNIHRNANFEIDNYTTKVFSDPTVGYKAIVQGIREYPLLVRLQGKLDKVTIIFKPMGINQFCVPKFGSLYPKPSCVFNTWNDLVEYENFLALFYGTDCISDRIFLLEEFLLKVYDPVENYAMLSSAIALLNCFEENIPIDEICGRLDVNTRTLNRAFKSFVGVSPRVYRKVARFRHSLHYQLVNDKFKSLTEVAYNSNYYDQAYFNKMYRGLTGSNPLLFFNSIDKLADERLIFEFLKK